MDATKQRNQRKKTLFRVKERQSKERGREKKRQLSFETKSKQQISETKSAENGMLQGIVCVCEDSPQSTQITENTPTDIVKKKVRGRERGRQNKENRNGHLSTNLQVVHIQLKKQKKRGRERERPKT